jgi:hypothetical protein
MYDLPLSVRQGSTTPFLFPCADRGVYDVAVFVAGITGIAVHINNHQSFVSKV